eukprot:g1058.t1
MSSDEEEDPEEELVPGRALWRNTTEYIEAREQKASSDAMPWSAPESGAVKKYFDKLLNVRPLYYLEMQEVFEFEVKPGAKFQDALSTDTVNAIRQADEADDKVYELMTGLMRDTGGYDALLLLLLHTQIDRPDLVRLIAREEESRQALTDYYEAAGGAAGAWRNARGWLDESKSTTDWFGIEQDDDGLVRRISMADNGVRGSLGDFMGKLEDAHIVDLRNNHVIGALPPSLGGCAALQVLDLRDNELRGSIPEQLSLCTNLRALRLQHNMLSGGIPPGFSALVNLRELGLEGNKLAGSMEEEIFADMVNLEDLELRRNNFFGPLPASLARCTALRRLSLGANMHSDVLPALGGCRSLEVIFIQRNRFSGEIPPGLGGCCSLKHFIAFNNKLRGVVPPDLGMCHTLLELDLSSNMLEGQIPPSFGRLGRLAVLDLSSNKLTGRIPRELGMCVSLYSIKLNSNRLTGEVPPELLELRRLKHLFLHDNELSGLKDAYFMLSTKNGLTFHLSCGPHFPKE